MNIENNNFRVQETKTFLKKNMSGNSSPRVDFSGIGILAGLTLQAFALLPLIFSVAQKKSAEEISILTPIIVLFSFIVFSIISFTKKNYIPLAIFIIGIIISTMLLVQKVMYDRSKNTAPVFDVDKIAKKL